MVVLHNAIDAWIDETRPTATFAKGRRLYVKAAGSNQRYAYIFFARPFPIGATILSAKFRVYNGSTFEGTATMSANRILEKWSVNRVNWNNKPAVASFTKQVAKTDAPPGTEWEIEITQMMQDVADGGKWFGLRITTDNGVGEWFHSAQGPERYRPQLEITWSDAPDAPEELSPAGGRAVSVDKPVLRFDFTDVSGDTDLAAIQVQIAPTEAELGTATGWDSGEKPASEPQLDLSTTSYPGLANNATAFWRVKVKDSAGAWSDWSEAESFKRVDKGVLTLNNPPAPAVGASYALIEDATPPINWSYSGSQDAYQIIIARADDKGEWLWTSGKITSTAQDVTLPKKILRKKNVTYNVRVRVWDSVNREKEGDRPIWTVVSRDFRLDGTTATDPVTNLTATADTPWPWMDIQWDRAIGMPDRYQIWRGDDPDDMELVEIIDSADVFVSGTHYQYKDRFAVGRTTQWWQVIPVVNGKAAKNNPIVSGRPRAASRWLMEEDGTDAVMLVNPGVGMSRQDGSEVHTTLSGESILVSQAMSGLYSGEVTGMLADEVVPGLPAYQMKKRFERIMKKSGQPLIFFNVNQTLRVFITKPSIEPIARPDGSTEYLVRFNFFEMRDDA